MRIKSNNKIASILASLKDHFNVKHETEHLTFLWTREREILLKVSVSNCIGPESPFYTVFDSS